MRQVNDFTFRACYPPNPCVKRCTSSGETPLLTYSEAIRIFCATKLTASGFEKADALATSLGFEKDDEDRLIAGVKYVLYSELNKGGNCYLPLEILTQRAS